MRSCRAGGQRDLVSGGGLVAGDWPPHLRPGLFHLDHWYPLWHPTHQVGLDCPGTDWPAGGAQALAQVPLQHQDELAHHALAGEQLANQGCGKAHHGCPAIEQFHPLQGFGIPGLGGGHALAKTLHRLIEERWVPFGRGRWQLFGHGWADKSGSGRPSLWTRPLPPATQTPIPCSFSTGVLVL